MEEDTWKAGGHWNCSSLHWCTNLGMQWWQGNSLCVSMEVLYFHGVRDPFARKKYCDCNYCFVVQSCKSRWQFCVTNINWDELNSQLANIYITIQNNISFSNYKRYISFSISAYKGILAIYVRWYQQTFILQKLWYMKECDIFRIPGHKVACANIGQYVKFHIYDANLLFAE